MQQSVKIGGKTVIIKSDADLMRLAEMIKQLGDDSVREFRTKLGKIVPDTGQ